MSGCMDTPANPCACLEYSDCMPPGLEHTRPHRLTEEQRTALRTRTASREVWKSLMDIGLVYWVPTTWLTSGGYFLTAKGEEAACRL